MSQKAIPIIDFDALITAINALSAPSATDVAVSTANMHYITEDDAQGALAELDAEAYAINSSLAQLLKVVVTTTATITINANSTVTNISESLPSVAGYTPLEVLTTWQSGSGSDQVVIYTAYKDGNSVKAKARNYGSSTATLNYEFNVLYIKSEFAPT